jgi:hypothetical protein
MDEYPESAVWGNGLPACRIQQAHVCDALLPPKVVGGQKDRLDLGNFGA